MKKDGTELVQRTLPLAKGPLVTVWEERDQETEEQMADELHYNKYAVSSTTGECELLP